MSTTFAIIPPHNDHDEQEPIEVAFRSGKAGGGVNISWLNPLAIYLPPEQRVVAIDNTAQGVETMADLFKLFEDSL